MAWRGPSDRDLAMVCHSYALYPHLDRYENMGFALRLAKVDDRALVEDTGASIERAKAESAIKVPKAR